MSPSEYIRYWEAAASHHVDIGHVPGSAEKKKFWRMDISELESDFSSKLRANEFFLVIEHAEDAVIDQISDNPYVQQQAAFWIISPRPTKDFDKANELLERCYGIAWDMFAKMWNDRLAMVFKGFKPETFRAIVFSGPFILGYRCSFTYEKPAYKILNPEKWLNEAQN